MTESSSQAAWNDGLHYLMRQCREDSERWFPKTQDDLAFMTLAMAGEVGEVANIVKKVVRGSMTLNDAMSSAIMGAQEKDTLQEEIVDVLIYLLSLMSLPQFKDVDWMDIWYKKRKLNLERFGDHRFESHRYLENQA